MRRNALDGSEMKKNEIMKCYGSFFCQCLNKEKVVKIFLVSFLHSETLPDFFKEFSRLCKFNTSTLPNCKSQVLRVLQVFWCFINALDSLQFLSSYILSG